MSERQRQVPSPKKIGLLAMLYFAQGMPFGFQANALGLYLTGLGLSMEKVSLARALALPWMFKVVWAPFVDRYWSARFGRRKSWIVPMQVLLALACIGCALITPAEHLVALLVFVLLMNLFAATQDIAVDGLAVDLLEPHELGAGNSAQVVGYKIGMAIGGGVLVAASKYIGWNGLFFSMAALYLLITGVVFTTKDPAPPQIVTGAKGASWAEIGSRMKAFVQRPGGLALLAFVGTYKMGESMADAMFGPWLVKVHHLQPETVAGWLGGYGIVGSILGSALGGLIATRFTLLRAVFVAASLRSIPLVGYWVLVAFDFAPDASTVVPLTVAEHFFGGILTTTMFAFMMSQVDRSVGATQYTLLASVEALGKSPASALSGFVVNAIGFSGTFALAAGLSFAFLGLFIVMRGRPNPSPG